MQSHSKIQRIIVVTLLNIIVLEFLIAILNITYAQFHHTVLHQKTLYEITKYTSIPTAHIAVGEGPKAIGAAHFGYTGAIQL